MDSKEKDDENIPLFDKIQPILAGKHPEKRAISMFCVSLLSAVGEGFVICKFFSMDLQLPNPIYRMSMLTAILVVVSLICLISTVSFIKTFQDLLKKPDSKKESQQSGHLHHKPKASHNSQDQRSEGQP